MTRICFVGNSHLASIKLAWDASSGDYPDLEASFFGAPAGNMSLMLPEDDGFLVSRDSALTRQLQVLWGADRFRPDDYDVLCLVGLGMSPSLLVRLYASFRSSLHRNRTGDFRLLSPECFQAAANGRVAGKLGGRVLARIREVSRRPVVIAAQAAPCLPSGDGHAEPVWLSFMLECGDDRKLIESFVEAVRQLPGANFLVLQPEITMLNLHATKPEYGEDAPRLNRSFSKHEAHNTKHMNAAYGALVLRDLYQLLRREGLAAGRAAQASAAVLELSA